MDNSDRSNNNQDNEVISDISSRSHRTIKKGDGKPNNGNGSRSNGAANTYRKNKKLIWTAVVVIVVLFALACVFKMGGVNRNVSSQINKNDYQAVFLTNGQVYFGKMSFLGSGYVKLTSVYYLQQKSDSTANVQDTKDSSAQNNDNMSLIKLGSEIHAPEDKMVIAQKEILFFENLKADGKVVKAIESYKPE